MNLYEEFPLTYWQNKYPLENCPFCGRKASYDCLVKPHTHVMEIVMPDEEYYQAFITCSTCECGMAGQREDSEEEAIKSISECWNMRV